MDGAFLSPDTNVAPTFGAMAGGGRSSSSAAMQAEFWRVPADPGSRTASLAGAIFSRLPDRNRNCLLAAVSDGPCLSGTPSPHPTWKGEDEGNDKARRVPPLPPLEAMGPTAISRAVNAIALCNRFIMERDRCDRREIAAGGAAAGSGTTAAPVRFVAFVPSVRVFVDREGRESRPDLPAEFELRRSMRMHLRLVSPPQLLVAAAAGSAEAAGVAPGSDVIRVALKTDPRRLSGLISSQWSRFEDGRSLPRAAVLVQAMGPRCIDKMVWALAMAWQRSSRAPSFEEGEGDLPSEVGFSCLPTHIELPCGGITSGGGGPLQEEVAAAGAGRQTRHRLYSGVQCELIEP